MTAPERRTQDSHDSLRQSAQHEAYALYVRLHWLLYDVPKGHPARAALAAAVVTASAHWRALMVATRKGQQPTPRPHTDLAVVAAAADREVFSPLTPRELGVLDAAARGQSNKEIARALAISDQTVKNHMTAILRKLVVNDRTQAVIYALRHGWLTLDQATV